MMVQLPTAEWTQSSDLAAIVSALDGQVRFVGGAVRDTLLGLPVHDVDLATPLLPEEVIAALSAADIKSIPTGIEHGTITAVRGDAKVEITTLRKDVSTDGRRATVAFSDDWREDAARRDFTINALYADPISLKISDYFGGLDDLADRRVVFIGEAHERIAEDHLRIMRYFRFLARFGQDQLDPTAYAACKNAAAKLKSLSRERIADELLKLLCVQDPRFAVGQMISGEIFANIIAELDAGAEAMLDLLVSREAVLRLQPSALRRLIALLPKNAKRAEKIAASLRLSKKQRMAIRDRLDKDTPKSDNIRSLAYFFSKEAATDMALLFAAEAEVTPALEQLADWDIPVFPLKGGDLIARGMEPGPAVAKKLQELEAQWVASGFVNVPI